MEKVRFVGRAIPEVGGGWVYRARLTSRVLGRMFPANEGWRLTPSGLNVIVNHPRACFCIPGQPHYHAAKEAGK
jgi:hypothetical protein